MKRPLLYIGMLCCIFACSRRSAGLRTGDLLFQVGRESTMSNAIAAATGDDAPIPFTHVGIAVCCDGADWVLEATAPGGVRMTALDEFLGKSASVGSRPAVVAMRLKDTTGIAASVIRARSFMGQPYDYSYRPDNGKMYCSELVWKSYRRPNSTRIFEARPMNFRAADGRMPEFWVELFEKSGEEIPEGLPGTNPADMAQDSALTEVFRWF